MTAITELKKIKDEYTDSEVVYAFLEEEAGGMSTEIEQAASAGPEAPDVVQVAVVTGKFDDVVSPEQNDGSEESSLGGCCCSSPRYKQTPRELEFQADLQKRLNRAIGQLNGIKAMIEDNRYCGDVLVQLSAAERAVHRISELLLHNHLKTCVTEQIRQGNDDAIDEAMELISKFGGK